MRGHRHGDRQNSERSSVGVREKDEGRRGQIFRGRMHAAVPDTVKIQLRRSFCGEKCRPANVASYASEMHSPEQRPMQLPIARASSSA